VSDWIENLAARTVDEDQLCAFIETRLRDES
jgi:hypothetical protein